MSGLISNRSHYHSPYASLAAAILESGVKCNDTRFLESDWADVLRELCAIDDEMYGGRGEVGRARVYKSSPHIGRDDG